MHLVPSKQTNRAIALMLYNATILAIALIVTKDLVSRVLPQTIVIYRFLIAITLFVPFLVYARKNCLMHWRQGVKLGIVLWGVFVLGIEGLVGASAANAGFVMGMFVLFVPFVNWFVSGAAPRKQHWLTAVGSIVGLYLLTDSHAVYSVATVQYDVMLIAAAVCVAIHIVMMRNASQLNLDQYVLNLQQYVVIVILSFAYVQLTDQFACVSDVTMSIYDWFLIAGLAVFATIVVHISQLYAGKFLQAHAISLLFLVTPLMRALIVWVSGLEVFSLTKASGGVITLLMQYIGTKYTF